MRIETAELINKDVLSYMYFIARKIGISRYFST